MRHITAPSFRHCPKTLGTARIAGSEYGATMASAVLLKSSKNFDGENEAGVSTTVMVTSRSKGLVLLDSRIQRLMPIFMGTTRSSIPGMR